MVPWKAFDVRVPLRRVRMNHLLADVLFSQELLEHAPVLRAAVGPDACNRVQDLLEHLRSASCAAAVKEEVIQEAAYLVARS